MACKHASMPPAPAPTRPWTLEAEGLRLGVRLTPRGGRDGIDSVGVGADGRSVLQVRVAAAPLEGAANAALVALLAKRLRMRRSDIAILSGETARLKVLLLSGDGPALAERLAADLDRR
ncbi:uncharacterized protein YggU (UPF0235/DUF167 family) [Methylobacterium sp. BE186]|uniref:DUF167 family protein n=1 Tax=Methylobacterium sp. BE186 TaxID=2817715 RepID=UPI002860B480|nr:uncharacterized protein YggU (UPF0235/DUF167 family) [Methylobacterium sp. BE186]